MRRYENALEKANYAQLAKAQEAQAAADQAANEDDEQVGPMPKLKTNNTKSHT